MCTTMKKIPSEIEVAPSYKLLILLHSFQCCIVYTIYTAYTAYIAFIAHTCYTAYTVLWALEQKGYHAYKYDIGFWAKSGMMDGWMDGVDSA